MGEHSFLSPRELENPAKKIQLKQVVDAVRKSDPDGTKTETKCDSKQVSTCRTMCRWLKLTANDDQAGCPFFEWQLRACDYVLPESRPAGTTEAIDCAVNFLRSTVDMSELGDYISALNDCVDAIPARVNASCHVAFDLLRGELHDYTQEANLKKDAAVLRGELHDAVEQAKVSLQTRTNEVEVVELLSKLLAKAGKLPGHYLVDDVQQARMYLDKLAPIPAVREQLRGALEDGRAAFQTTELFSVKEAIAWLDVAVQKGERYKVGPPLSEAVDILQKLLILKAALLDLHAAEFQGNISVGTKSEVPETIEILSSAMERAKAAGLLDAMPLATGMLSKLKQFKAAVEAEENATAVGVSIIESPGKKQSGTLKEGVEQLSSAVHHAQKLGLGDNASTAAAIDTLARLKYIQHVREALIVAVNQARHVLDTNGANLTDDKEESAEGGIEPAVKWGSEVGLTHGMSSARKLKRKLAAVEKAKEAMVRALETGNATLEAKSHVADAVELLEEAVAGDGQVGITAGLSMAEDQLKLLKGLLAAQAELIAASKEGRESVENRTGYEDAVGSLEKAIHDGREAGLVDEVEIAGDQLDKLKKFVKAETAMTEAFERKPPARGPPKPERVQDVQPEITFNRSGFKVEDLPTVAGGADDGDDDFDEHIKALNKSIAESKGKGTIDPDMLAQVAVLQNLKQSYAALREANEMGTEALRSKEHIANAVVKLSVALQEARESGLELGVSHGADLLAKLNLIQPARDEMQAAMLQANVSMHTVSGMDRALMRLNQAIDVNRQLGLEKMIPQAKKLVQDLLKVKKAFVTLKAAVLQGQIALKTEQGEEAAIAELNSAIEAADAIDLHKGMQDAVILLHELMHMNAEKQQIQAAMNPNR